MQLKMSWCSIILLQCPDKKKKKKEYYCFPLCTAVPSCNTTVHILFWHDTTITQKSKFTQVLHNNIDNVPHRLPHWLYQDWININWKILSFVISLSLSLLHTSSQVQEFHFMAFILPKLSWKKKKITSHKMPSAG